MGVVIRRWVWLETIGVVSRVFSSYNLYIPTALVSVLFCSSIPTSFFILLKYIQERKNIYKMNKKVGMLLQKSTDTRGVGISSMRKSIYLLKTTPSSHTHRSTHSH